MRRLKSLLPGLALLLVAALASAQRGAKAKEVLADGPRATLAALLDGSEVPLARFDELYGAALMIHGDAQPLIDAFETSISAPATSPEARRDALRGLAHVLHREGRLAAALTKVEAALALRSDEALALERALLLDALDRVDAALAAYAELRDTSKDPAIVGKIGLRMALLEALRSDKSIAMAGRASSGGAGAASVAAVPMVSLMAPGAALSAAPVVVAGDATRRRAVAPATSADDGPRSALFEYASARKDERELCNAAAVVLALIGRQHEAIGLFEARGEGSERFRQEVRLAEWALAAQQPKAAQEHAWTARGSATLQRDRLYALTVLVEAYRADESLPALIERFAAEPELDAESRHAWIDLLRETARIDEALALFKRSGEASFTPEMRRELLEMCREAGRDDELVRTYGELIEAEPESVEWREGLSRYWLERGRRDEGAAVWRSWVDAHTDAPHLLAAAAAARDLGLDELARECAERCTDGEGNLAAHMFLFDFEVRHGRVEAALEELERFDREADPRAPQRVQLAEAFERIGHKRRAAQVLEAIRVLRGADDAEEDLEMRLAWLLSEVGDESAALERWRNLWRRVTSVSRRRQVEDRLMATASRLGVLSDIAVELEEKLADKSADERDAALLVRLYQKVGDPVTAAEVIEEHMRQAGADPIAALVEKSRVFLAGKDYYHFEQAVRKLVEIDGENREDHLRQLAMSNLERGRPQEARAVLEQLAQGANPSDAAEFEAGVLALAGLNEDAARTYRRGLAAHPERIDTYLLLANTLSALSQTERATGMFQYLAETADRDDLFTVAIDGILNMRAKPPVLRWALRVTLERVAGRNDKMYLYQLCSDLYDELGNSEGKLRALSTSLAIAGEQRASVLREMMDVAQGTGGNSYTIVNGVLVQRRTGGDAAQRLAYGRRLIGLGDLVPPDVYLELGRAFLDSGEVSNASKTFSMARDVPDYAGFQRQVAQSFEGARFVENALAIYERAMASEGVDTALLLKVGELHEQLGRDGRACELYAQGIELLLARHPLTASGNDKQPGGADDYGWRPRNVGEFEKHFGALSNGFIVAAAAEQARALFDAQRALFEADLAEAASRVLDAGQERRLAAFPRVLQRAAFLRRLGLAFGFSEETEAFDLELLAALPDDDTLLESLCEARARLGFTAAAGKLAARSAQPEERRRRALARVGVGGLAPERGALAPQDVVVRLLPILIEGDRAQASLLLRSVQLGEIKKEELPQLQLLVSAALFLDDDAAIVQLGRHAVRAIVQSATGWEEQQQVEALLKRARAALERESYGLIVDALVEAMNAKKDSFERYSRLLLEIQKELGRPLFDSAALTQRIEECLPDQIYYVDELLQLAPLDARLELLQAIWPKVPATARAGIACDVLITTPRAVPPALAEFVLGAFEDGLGQLDDAQLLTFRIRNAFDMGAANLALVARMAELASRKHPTELTFVATLAAAKYKLGEREGALEALRATLALIPHAEQQWSAREAREALVDAFVPADAELLLAEIEKLAVAGDANQPFAELRSQVFDKLGDEPRKLAALEQAVAERPDDVERLSALYSTLGDGAGLERSLALLEKLIALDPQNPNWRNALVRRWRKLRNPARALATQRAGEQGDAVQPDVEEARKLEPASIRSVKKAVDEGRFEDARALYRRTWRDWGRDDGRVGGVIVYRSYGSASEPLWPDDAPAAAPVRSRGGLDDLQLDAAPRAGPKDGPTVFDKLAELPFGLDELRREARSMNADRLQGSRGLLRGLQRAEVASAGPQAAVEDWIERVRSERAGTLDRALLLSYFEDHIGALEPADRAVLGDLAPAVHPLDGTQLRALARLYAKLGDSARASRIYQWCATLATASRWTRNGAISAYDLIAEVPEYLHGEELLDAVDAILTRADPGGDLWERDGYLALVIESWEKIGGPQVALARCRERLAAVEDLSRGLLREAALPAAHLYAENGEFAPALRALEIALCRFELGQIGFDPEDRYAMRSKLQPPMIGFDEVRKLFPRTLASGRESQWLIAARDALLAWEQAGRLEPSAVRPLLVAVAVRLHERGQDGDAQALLERIIARANAGADARHLILDLERLLGHEARAREIEDELLAAHTLDPERVPEVIERVRRTAGPEKALELGAQAAEWTPHPALVDALIALASELQRPDDIARFTQLRDDNLAAAQVLETTW